MFADLLPDLLVLLSVITKFMAARVSVSMATSRAVVSSFLLLLVIEASDLETIGVEVSLNLDHLFLVVSVEFIHFLEIVFLRLLEFFHSFFL